MADPLTQQELEGQSWGAVGTFGPLALQSALLKVADGGGGGGSTNPDDFDVSPTIHTLLNAPDESQARLAIGAASQVDLEALSESQLDGAKYLGLITALDQSIPSAASAGNGFWYQSRTAGQLTDPDAGGAFVTAGGYLISNGTVWLARDGEDNALAFLPYNITKFRDKLAAIQAGDLDFASYMVTGDSVRNNFTPEEFLWSMFATYGVRGVFMSPITSAFFGYSLNVAGGASSGATTPTGRNTSSPNGVVFLLNGSGHRVTWVMATRMQKSVNRATVVFNKIPSGGVFKVQYRRAASTGTTDDYWQDAPGFTAISASAVSLTTDKVVVDLPALELGAQVAVRWVSGGECEILGVLLEDTTASGIVYSDWGLNGLDMSTSNQYNGANLAVLLGVIQPDLISWYFQDGSTGGTVAAKIATMRTNYDAAYASDWLYMVPAPGETEGTESEVSAKSQVIIDFALSKGSDYFWSTYYIPSYESGNERGYYADSVHFSQKGIQAIGSKQARQWDVIYVPEASADPDDYAHRNVITQEVTLKGEPLTSSLRKGIGLPRALFGALRFRSGNNDYAYAASLAAPGAGSFTISCFIDVPTTPASFEIMGLRTSTSGGNQTGAINVQASTTMLRVFLRTASTSLTFGGTTEGTAFWALAGEVAMITVRRDASAAAGVTPFTMFINDVAFPMNGTSPADGLSDVLGTLFKLGAVTASATADTDIMGAAYYGSALTDDQIKAIARTGRFPVGSILQWPMRERSGTILNDVSGNSNRGRFGGSPVWTRPNVIGPEQAASNTATLKVNTRYVLTSANGTLNVLTLPAVAAMGDWIEIVGKAQGKWQIAQNASPAQQILEGAGTTVGTNITTAGASGQLNAANRYDCIRIECLDDTGTLWVIVHRNGSPAFV